MNKVREIIWIPAKRTSYHKLTETLMWNRCSYQVPVIFVTNESTNDNNKFYNMMVQYISWGWGDCDTKFVALRDRFFETRYPEKHRYENGLFKIFDLREQNVDVSNQAVFFLHSRVSMTKRGKYHDGGPNHIILEARILIIIFNDDVPPIPGRTKMQAYFHDLYILCKNTIRCRRGRYQNILSSVQWNPWDSVSLTWFL